MLSFYLLNLYFLVFYLFTTFCFKVEASLKTYSDFDSKFRFVIVAAKRAKQLLKGSKPKLTSKSKNLIRIAQQEVKQGLIEYEIVD